jgi:hypothetical protein
MVFYMLLEKSRSHAAWRSKCSVPPRRDSGEQNVKNNLKITVWDICLGPMLGINLDHENAKSVPVQRGTRPFFCQSVPMQRGTRFFIFDVPSGALCWAQRGRRKRCKTNAFLRVFKKKGTLGATTKWILKSKTSKICLENEWFVRLPWELFGIHFGWSCFCLPIVGPQGGLAAFVKTALKVTLF